MKLERIIDDLVEQFINTCEENPIGLTDKAEKQLTKLVKKKDLPAIVYLEVKKKILNRFNIRNP